MSRWIDAEWIRNVYADFEHYDNRNDWTTPIANVLAVIDDAPSIDIEPKRGEWIYGEHDVAMCDGYRCDKCGFFVPWDYEHKSIDFINDYHFCPHCGARMKGADDEITTV